MKLQSDTIAIVASLFCPRAVDLVAAAFFVNAQDRFKRNLPSGTL